jgi:hypothetical protein
MGLAEPHPISRMQHPLARVLGSDQATSFNQRVSSVFGVSACMPSIQPPNLFGFGRHDSILCRDYGTSIAIAMPVAGPINQPSFQTLDKHYVCGIADDNAHEGYADERVGHARQQHAEPNARVGANFWGRKWRSRPFTCLRALNAGA